MSINRSFAVVMLVWAGMNWPVAEASESDTLVERHAQAIAMAREGELDASIELIEALRAEDSRKAIPPLHGALLKNEQDVHLFEQLVFLDRRTNNR